MSAQRDARGRFLKGNTTGPRFEPGNTVGEATKFKPGPDERRGKLTGEEGRAFRFKKGYDSRRHVFTSYECRKGYNALVEKIQLDQTVGIYWAKRYAFRQICKTESVRFKNSKDHQREYKEKHGQDHTRGPVKVEASEERSAGHYGPDDYEPQPLRIFKEGKK